MCHQVLRIHYDDQLVNIPRDLLTVSGRSSCNLQSAAWKIVCSMRRGAVDRPLRVGNNGSDCGAHHWELVMTVIHVRSRENVETLALIVSVAKRTKHKSINGTLRMRQCHCTHSLSLPLSLFPSLIVCSAEYQYCTSCVNLLAPLTFRHILIALK